MLPLLFAQTSCADPGCNTTCVDRSSVRFEPALTERGQYRLHVSTPEGLDAECVLTVPATPEFLDCALWVSTEPLPADVPEIRGLGLAGLPSRIDVLLEKDGTVLADASLTPEYESVSTCLASCYVAETPLRVTTD